MESDKTAQDEEGELVVDVEDDEAGEGSGRGGENREALDGSVSQPPAKRPRREARAPAKMNL